MVLRKGHLSRIKISFIKYRIHFVVKLNVYKTVICAGFTMYLRILLLTKQGMIGAPGTPGPQGPKV